MAQCEDVREPNGETEAVSREATAGPADTPPVTTVATNEAINEAASEAATATKAGDAKPQSAEPTVCADEAPTVPHAGDGTTPSANPDHPSATVARPTRAAPTVLPPPLRRDHDGRASAARSPVRPKPDAGKASPPPAKEKPKSRFALLA